MSGDVKAEYFPIGLSSHPDWVLDASGGAVKNGTNLILYKYHGGDNQLWHYDGTYIRSKKNPNFVVDVAGCVIKCRTNIQVWECNKSDAQKWNFDGLVFRLRKNPDFVLDLQGNCKEARRNIHLWKWNNTAAQKWTHQEPFEKKPLAGYFAIRLQSHPEWVVDIQGGRIQNGTKLILWKYHGRNNQLWLYDGTYIRSKADPDYVIDVYRCNVQNGSTVHLWKCNSSAAQQWDFDGSVFHLRQNHNFVIDLHANHVDAGNHIHLWNFNNSGAQKWAHEEDKDPRTVVDLPIIEELFQNLPQTARYKQYRASFLAEEVDLEILVEMDIDILKELGVNKKLHLKKIMNELRKLFKSFEGIPVDAGAPTGVRLALTAHTGNNVQCVRERGGHAQCANRNKGAWEMLQLKLLGDGHYVLTSLHNGCNLQCRPDGAVSFLNKNEQLWEKWSIERQSEKWFFISAHTGKVLQCDGRGQMRCANHNRLGYEAFQLVAIDGYNFA